MFISYPLKFCVRIKCMTAMETSGTAINSNSQYYYQNTTNAFIVYKCQDITPHSTKEFLDIHPMAEFKFTLNVYVTL